MKRFLLIAGALSLALVAGAGAVVASGSGEHPRRNSTEAVTVQATAQMTGGGCKAGYDTQTSTLTPPDDSTADNVPAATVTLNKPCPGAVVGQFTGEVSTTAGGFIHLDMRATCVATGGFSTPCTVGQQVFASPGHSFIRNYSQGVSTEAAMMVWSGLRRGVWRFEALPGGGSNANLQFRTFFVEAFQGG